jgi:steroid delta-isomerase-like uncharacterized protein
MRTALSLTMACALAACGTHDNPSAPRSPAMPSDANKAIVRRLFEEYFNKGLVDRLGEIVSPDFVGPGGQRGPAAFATVLGALRTGFADIAYTVDDIIAEGNRVAVRWTWRGTHTGQFRTYPASGKKVANTGFAIFEVSDGKLTRSWLETDRLGFLLSIEAIPYDPAYGPPPAAN